MSEINVTVYWDMTPCSLVNMNTEVSDKPADTFFRKGTKVPDFPITLAAKA